jgi:capsule synthesis protein PGA_cap
MLPMTQESATQSIRFAAMGDLLLPAGPDGAGQGRDAQRLLSPLRALLGDFDVVLGNLECTLPGDGGLVPTEPRVISSPEHIRDALSAGFNVVSLANNHAFDCFDPGFDRVRTLLDKAGVKSFGAGRNLEEATAPTIMETRGLRLAFLGAVDERTGPNRFATTNSSGVAPMDSARMLDQVRRLRDDVDHVIVIPHWGEERFAIPSPAQVQLARDLVDAGASMVLGHHPHVVQGMETWRGAPIVYSLGNLSASEVPFTDGDKVTWNRVERTGCLFLAELDGDSVGGACQIPTYDDGETVSEDTTSHGSRLIARRNRALARGVTLRRYRREALRVKTLRPILSYMSWSRLKTLRWRQVRRALASVLHAQKAR